MGGGLGPMFQWGITIWCSFFLGGGLHFLLFYRFPLLYLCGKEFCGAIVKCKQIGFTEAKTRKIPKKR